MINLFLAQAVAGDNLHKPEKVRWCENVIRLVSPLNFTPMGVQLLPGTP